MLDEFERSGVPATKFATMVGVKGLRFIESRIDIDTAAPLSGRRDGNPELDSPPLLCSYAWRLGAYRPTATTPSIPKPIKVAVMPPSGTAVETEPM